PLLSVFFNDRAVWDEYSGEGVVSIAVETRVGENMLQVASANCPIFLINLTYRFAGGDENLLNERSPN
ncbi:MAG: hypothetical protein JW884_04270, partial [Deltaproteobacteria bacterium]|nr:hypothetical protein [Deltaproteobacteria bacterium]